MKNIQFILVITFVFVSGASNKCQAKQVTCQELLACAKSDYDKAINEALAEDNPPTTIEANKTWKPILSCCKKNNNDWSKCSSIAIPESCEID